MKDFEGKVAFITGGGSGVALGQAKVFSRAGCKVVIADIRQDHLDRAMDYFKKHGGKVHPIQLDITDREAYARAADEAEKVFGPVQLLFNTAGVSTFGAIEKSTYGDYDWQMEVNFGGMVNGVQTFVPRMIEYGKGGYIVSTASLGGLLPSPGAAIYTAAKYATVGLSECLHVELKKYNIGVSVLCPANVNSNIAEATKTRNPKYGETGYVVNEDVIAGLARIYSHGMDPEELAGHVKAAMEKDQLYIIPYPEARAGLRMRYDAILASLPPEDSDPEGVAKRARAFEGFRMPQ